MDDGAKLDKRLLRAAFEKAAPGYDAAAVLQHEVCRRMLSRLEIIKLQPAFITKCEIKILQLQAKRAQKLACIYN